MTPVIRAGDNLPAELLARPVEGSGLSQPDDAAPPTLGDQLDPNRPTLLVFLRHLGCPFSREMVKDVRVAAERADDVGRGDGRNRYPRVLFVHRSTPRQGGRFLGRYWPAAPAVSDPAGDLYDAVGLGRARLGQVFGPAVWPCLIRAARKGHGPARPTGDVWAMPGLLLVSPAGRVVLRHDFAHIGNRFDFASLAADASCERRSDPAEAGVPGDGPLLAV